MPRQDVSKMTPAERDADAAERAERRAALRAEALEAKAAAARKAGHDPDRYGELSAGELEKLAHAKQDAPRAERLAIRVALDRALTRRLINEKLANLSAEERSAVVSAGTLRTRGGAAKP